MLSFVKTDQLVQTMNRGDGMSPKPIFAWRWKDGRTDGKRSKNMHTRVNIFPENAPKVILTLHTG